MSKLPTSRSDLMASGATCIVHVSSEGERAIWTELGLWWIEDTERPFIAVVERCIDPDGTTEVPAFKAQAFGSHSRAIKWFEPSNLRDELVAEVPDDVAECYPDANELRARKAAAGKGYAGDGSIEDVLDWLYEGQLEGMTTNGIARRVEDDFGVPWRTVTNAINGKAATGWYHGFIHSMRFFDRKAFAKARKVWSE